MNSLLDALVAPINVNVAKPTEKRTPTLACFHQFTPFFLLQWGVCGYLYELRQEPMIMYKYIWVEKGKGNNA